MGMLGSDELNRRLGYHPATRATIPLYEDSRARVIALACHWDEELPPGRELAEAQTCLQDALMWANAAVACNLAPLEDPAGRSPNPLVEQMAHNRQAQTVELVLKVPDGMTLEELAGFAGRQIAEQLRQRSGGER